MFTGIITDVGTIDSVEQRGDLRATIRTAFDTSDVALGASIACSGACLTVVDKGEGWFAVDLSAETVARTAPGRWQAGAQLNLERAMKLGDELGGHIVAGHVDGIGTVAAIDPQGDSLRITVSTDRTLAPYLAPKGSVTLDGISLTVNTVEDSAEAVTFGINIIPHTAAVTTFGQLAAGDAVHIEIDILARYLGRMEQVRHVFKF